MLFAHEDPLHGHALKQVHIHAPCQMPAIAARESSHKKVFSELLLPAKQLFMCGVHHDSTSLYDTKRSGKHHSLKTLTGRM